MSHNFRFSGHCRNVRFTIDPIHGRRLNNHVIRTTGVINEDICRLKCYLEPDCVSYNFKKIADTDGKHKCELNNATYEHDNEHLAKDKDYVYRGAEVTFNCQVKDCSYHSDFFFQLWLHFRICRETQVVSLFIYFPPRVLRAFKPKVSINTSKVPRESFYEWPAILLPIIDYSFRLLFYWNSAPKFLFLLALCCLPLTAKKITK